MAELHSGLVGKGTKLICIQNSDPFYRHLHKDGGERRRGRDDFREERAGGGEQMQKEKRAVNFLLSRE